MSSAWGNCRSTVNLSSVEMRNVNAPTSPEPKFELVSDLLPQFEHLRRLCLTPGIKHVNPDGTIRQASTPQPVLPPPPAPAPQAGGNDVSKEIARAAAMQVQTFDNDQRFFGPLLDTALDIGRRIFGRDRKRPPPPRGTVPFTPTLVPAQPRRQSCPPGFGLDSLNRCVELERGPIRRTIEEFLPGGRTGRETANFTPVRGSRGEAAFDPVLMSTQRLVCPRGFVLGIDDLCYSRRDLPRNSSFRKWKPGRRPKFTGGDLNAIARAKSLAGKAEEIFLDTNPRKKAVNR